MYFYLLPFQLYQFTVPKTGSVLLRWFIFACYLMNELTSWISHTLNVNMRTLTIPFVILALLHDIYTWQWWLDLQEIGTYGFQSDHANCEYSIPSLGAKSGRAPSGALQQHYTYPYISSVFSADTDWQWSHSTRQCFRHTEQHS